MNGWLWFALWLVVDIAVPQRRLCRGYVSRLLAKVIPPKRWWYPKGRFHHGLYRNIIWWLLCGVLNQLVARQFRDILFWGGLILLYLDDYVNGDDDDPKKRWEGVKNKIKWKMRLPEPLTDQVAS